MALRACEWRWRVKHIVYEVDEDYHSTICRQVIRGGVIVKGSTKVMTNKCSKCAALIKEFNGACSD